MKKLWLLAVLALAAIPSMAGAQTEKSGTVNGKPYFEASDTITEQATVIKIDSKGRYVTMTTSDGDTLKVKCGPEVKNFKQIKVGDTVKATYTEKLRVQAEGPGSAETTTEAYEGSAKEGSMPAASLTERTQYKAKITAIDKANGTATLKGLDGTELVITPRKPENLDKVAVGDLVSFTLTQTVAVSVERVAKK